MKKNNKSIYFSFMKIILILLGVSFIFGVFHFRSTLQKNAQNILNFDVKNSEINSIIEEPEGIIINPIGKNSPHPLSIEALRNEKFEGSAITILSKNAKKPNYTEYIANYNSEGLKINGLLTIPDDFKGKKLPSIVFVHGYIAPEVYKTTEKYVAYVDYYAKRGYIVFKIDLRGHADSEGEAEGAYGSNGYTRDVLNAVASFRNYPLAHEDEIDIINHEKIGVWGHSMGGYLALRSAVVDKKLSAVVVWAGVVGTHEDMIYNWRSRPPFPTPLDARRRWRQILLDEYGTPRENPKFWQSLSANFFITDLQTPIQIHHGDSDETVPVSFSQNLHERLILAGNTSEYFEYAGDDHNLSRNFGVASGRSADFFDKYMK